MTLVASLIVKNERARFLEPCIRSLQDFCDEIAVVDDGSTDGTFEWLMGQDRVNVMRLPVSDGFFDGHEGRRRQYLLDHTLALNPSWVLSIDADEVVADGSRVRDFTGKGHPVGSLEMVEVWELGEKLRVRRDGGWRPHSVPILWRADSGSGWSIQDRALACGREPEQIRQMRARSTGTEIYHLGWSNPETRQERYDRYAIADGGRFNQSRHLESILWQDKRVQLLERPWPKGLSLKDGVVTYEGRGGG